MEQLKHLLYWLDGNHADAVLGLFSTEPHVDAQRGGKYVGADEVRIWVAETSVWLRSLFARFDDITFFYAAQRAVHEISVTIKVEGQEIDLPFVVVADCDDDRLTAIRTYHSTWPYTGTHSPRTPPLPVPTGLVLPDVVKAYLSNLENGDVAALQNLFTEQGYVREPSGARFTHQGMAGRAEFYNEITHPGMPKASFHPLTVTDDGLYVAFEYDFVIMDTHTAGIAVIERTREGKIAAVRITDDAGF